MRCVAVVIVTMQVITVIKVQGKEVWATASETVALCKPVCSGVVLCVIDKFIEQGAFGAEVLVI